jgi:DNA-binding response OmpR family regulator
MKILLVEDDLTLNKNIFDALSAEKMIVATAFDGLIAERMMRKDIFDCIVLDINLPGMSGFDLCKSFRLFNSSTPVLILSAFDELEDKVKGFGCGADDYLTKPFFMRELVIRINALVKRTNQNHLKNQDEKLTAGDIVVMTAQKKVFRQGQEVPMTPREFMILKKLCEKKGDFVTKSELIAEIWGNSFETNTNTVEVYINFLRNKLDKPFGKNSIKTKVGYGYYLETE